MSQEHPTLDRIIAGVAPRPPRSSLNRSLYDALATEKFGGGLTIDEIRNLVAATDDAARWPTLPPTRAQVFTALAHGTRRGWFDTADPRRRAPLSNRWWIQSREEHEIRNARMAAQQKVLVEAARRRRAAGKATVAKQAPPSAPGEPYNRLWLLGVGFLIGAVAALAGALVRGAL